MGNAKFSENFKRNAVHPLSGSGLLASHEKKITVRGYPVAESCFNLLKLERIHRRTYKTREDARRDIFDYIEMFYNPKCNTLETGCCRL